MLPGKPRVFQALLLPRTKQLWLTVGSKHFTTTEGYINLLTLIKETIYFIFFILGTQAVEGTTLLSSLEGMKNFP